MAKIGGARTGAGRRRGSVSQRSVDILAGAMSEGLSPVEYMLGIMRDTSAETKHRDWAAEKSAPFVHPRPAPVAREIRLDLPDTNTAEGIRLGLNRVARAVAAGEIAPSEGQSLVAVIEAQRKAIETGELVERIERLEKLAEAK